MGKKKNKARISIIKIVPLLLATIAEEEVFIYSVHHHIELVVWYCSDAEQ